MDSLVFDVSELPGTYDCPGFEMNMKLKTGEKIKVRVPAQHIAYNIILPKVCKAIDPENYRNMIKEHITGIKPTADIRGSVCYLRNDSEFCEDSSYGFSRMMVIKDTGKVSEFAEDLCAETGHALSGDRFGIPEIHELHEYYDYLAQKIGTDSLKKTKFAFETDSEIRYIGECVHEIREKLSTNFYCMRKLRKSFSKAAESPSHKTLTNLKEIYEDAIIARHNFKKAMDVFASENVRNHARGYAMAEIMYNNLGKEAFIHHDRLFMQRDRRAVPKPVIEKKLSKNDMRILKSALSKIEYMEKISDAGYPKIHESLQRSVGEFLENSGIEVEEMYRQYEPVRRNGRMG